MSAMTIDGTLVDGFDADNSLPSALAIEECGISMVAT
jgi:hypothetical protein